MRCDVTQLDVTRVCYGPHACRSVSPSLVDKVEQQTCLICSLFIILEIKGPFKDPNAVIT